MKLKVKKPYSDSSKISTLRKWKWNESESKKPHSDSSEISTLWKFKWNESGKASLRFIWNITFMKKVKVKKPYSDSSEILTLPKWKWK